MAEKKTKKTESAVEEKKTTKKKTTAKETEKKETKKTAKTTAKSAEDQTAIFEKALQDLLKLAGDKNNLLEEIDIQEATKSLKLTKEQYNKILVFLTNLKKNWTDNELKLSVFYYIILENTNFFVTYKSVKSIKLTFR